MTDNKFVINLISSVLLLIINTGISFFLYPYIIKQVGVESYGFVSLAGNFINYASLFSIALNSMAGRFITIEIYRDNWSAANKYFTSTIIANIFVAGAILIPSVLCIFFIDELIKVPREILIDVKTLFGFLLANFLFSIITSSFNIATFARNKLYLQSLRNIDANILKVVILSVLFIRYTPAISYLGIATFISSLYGVVFNIYYTKVLLPDIKIDKSFFDLSAVIELITSGIWNVVTRVGQLLLEGVDLLISNLFISPTAMGTLALAKTIPTIISSLMGTVVGLFLPDFTILYAKDKTDELVISIKRSMKLIGMLINIPIAILVVFGDKFYRLWVPTQDARLLQILSIITVFTLVFSSSINGIYGIFTVINKLKVNSLVLVFSGVVNVLIVLTLLKLTDLGIYAIAGVSTVISIIRNLAFTAPFGARCLNMKWYTFYPEIFKTITAFTLVTLVGLPLNYIFRINSWIILISLSLLLLIVGLFINIAVVYDKNDRKYTLNLIKQKLRYSKAR